MSEPTQTSLRQRLQEGSLIDANGCIVWQGRLSPKGYGLMSVGGRPVRTHRVAYEEYRSPIPDGLVIDHLCRNRACINPDHLEPTTNRENILRGVSPSALNANKSTCIRGHEFTPENTYVGATGRRTCRECRRARKRSGASGSALDPAAFQRMGSAANTRRADERRETWARLRQEGLTITQARQQVGVSKATAARYEAARKAAAQ